MDAVPRQLTRWCSARDYAGAIDNCLVEPVRDQHNQHEPAVESGYGKGAAFRAAANGALE